MNAIPKRGTLDLEQPIYDRIFAAIADRRLPSGIQLTEETLASLFNVSRARIRKVLTRLQQDHLVDLIPNRGAFVARPSKAETAQVMEARRTIEADMCRQLCARSAAERQAAVKEISRHTAKTGTGRFHTALARQSGNDILLGFLTCLIRRSALISATYLPTAFPIDPALEHEAMLDQLARGDGEGMAATISAHLKRLEAALDFTATNHADVKLEQILRL